MAADREKNDMARRPLTQSKEKEKEPLTRKQQQTREAEKERRSLLKRRKHIEHLHWQLMTLGLGEDDFYTFYLEALDLPRDLEIALSSMAHIYSMKDELSSDVLLEDLLLHGKASDTYRKLLTCWDYLGKEFAFQWDSRQHMEPSDDFVDAIPNIYFKTWAPDFHLSPIAVGELLAEELSEPVVHFGFWTNLEERIKYESKVPKCLENARAHLEQYITEESWKVRQGTVPLRESPLYSLFLNLEFIDKKHLREFLSLVDECNVEWAMASYDWSSGERGKLIPELQCFVDSSPWIK